MGDAHKQKDTYLQKFKSNFKSTFCFQITSILLAIISESFSEETGFSCFLKVIVDHMSHNYYSKRDMAFFVSNI